jgi:hypothetical protein
VGDRCEKYFHNARYMTAIEVVARNARWGLEEMCNLERIWDIQAEDAMVINKKGEEEPHVRVYLHRNEDTCHYMVRNADLVVTTAKCYSNF